MLDFCSNFGVSCVSATLYWIFDLQSDFTFDLSNNIWLQRGPTAALFRLAGAVDAHEET